MKRELFGSYYSTIKSWLAVLDVQYNAHVKSKPEHSPGKTLALLLRPGF